MKKIILTTAVMVLSSSVFAQNVVVKECTVNMKNLESNATVDMTIQVIAKSDKSVSAVISQTAEGVSGSYDDIVEVLEENVRAGLTAQSEVEDLNQAEGLIVHAMTLSEDPVFQGAYSAGIDLEKVRSAKIFTIGKKTNMGSSAIVEARDANNQVLGSFLGGFLVFPCK